MDCALLLDEDLLSLGSLVIAKQALFHRYRSHPEGGLFRSSPEACGRAHASAPFAFHISFAEKLGPHEAKENDSMCG